MQIARSTLGLTLFTSCILLLSAHKHHMRLRDRGGYFLRTRRVDNLSSDELFAGSTLRDTAWRRKFSTNSNSSAKCEIRVTNELEEVVVFCWIDFEGNLRNFHNINDRSIKDKSVRNDHVEYAYTGHSFVCLKRGVNLPKKLVDVKVDQIIFHFTPSQGSGCHNLLLTPKPKSKWSFLRSELDTIQVKMRFEKFVTSSSVDTIIDISDKHYDIVHIAGFRIHYEPRVFEDVPDLERVLTEDLEMLRRLLPLSACAQLQAHTPLYLNKSLIYGPKANPIVGTSCCFHPIGGADWLKRHGLSVEKEGGVEIASAQHYLQARQLWGTGGILVHEYSHAFHNKCCDQGYDNPEILQRYNEAMAERLYDCVPVHGPQGTSSPEGAKAYACANCMEFFAELSCAFHYHLDNDVEYNKWFPHNRMQLQQHDARSFDVLRRQWHQFD